MRGDERKAAVAAYKERKSVAGIYAVRCNATAQTWVGQSASLGSVQNRIWFTLRLASSLNHDLQSAWREHGAESFSFEVIERLPDDELPYSRNALLKDRLAFWRSALLARLI